MSLPDKQFLEQHYGREVMYLPIGIQLPELEFEEAREFLARHGLEPGNYMIFTAGPNIRRKGCHLVLQAMQTIDNDMPLLILATPILTLTTIRSCWGWPTTARGSAGSSPTRGCSSR